MVQPEDNTTDEKCALCDKVLAVFGLVVGLVFLYISIDLLAGSRLTSALSRTREED